MLKSTQNLSYVSSKEAKRILKVSDCRLAHLREVGKLPFVKKGNAYMYEDKGLQLTRLKLDSENA